MNNFLVECFFLILPSDLESVLNSAFLGTHIDLFEEKSFQLYFKKNYTQSILLYSMVLSRWGRHSTYMRRDAGEEGGRKFSSKMPHALCPICLTFLVVHFYTYIYVSILNLSLTPNMDATTAWISVEACAPANLT